MADTQLLCRKEIRVPLKMFVNLQPLHDWNRDLFDR